MKKYLIIAALSIAPTFALAQSLDSEVDAELDQIAAAQQSPQVQEVKDVQRSNTNQAVGSQTPIYIMNHGSAVAAQSAQAESQQQQVQTQPTTLIQASPLTESRAEQIRRARQNAELQTEQKIVEKLEASRMEDEQRRADALFGDRLQKPQEAPVVQVQQVQQPAYVQPEPVQQIQVAEPKENTRDIVREEIRAAMLSEAEAEAAPVESRYFGAMVGIGDYPDVRNVRSNYSLGAQFGTKYDNFIVEGTFQFSNYNVDQLNYSFVVPQTVEVNQYSGALAAKYEFFGGLIRPVVGGLVQYSYRTFAWADNNYGYGYGGGYYNSDTATSHAVDVGALVGVDLAFNSKFSLGMDFRYLWNLASRVNTNSNSVWLTGPQYGTPIERLQYYVLSLVGRVTF